MTTDIALEPCPYCGEVEPVVLMPFDAKRKLYQVTCRSCMARGPSKENYNIAKQMWNAIAKDPCEDCELVNVNE